MNGIKGRGYYSFCNKSSNVLAWSKTIRKMIAKIFLVSVGLVLISNYAFHVNAFPTPVKKTECPAIPLINNVKLEQMTGEWFELQRIIVMDLFPNPIIKVKIEGCSGLKVNKLNKDTNELPYELATFALNNSNSLIEQHNKTFTITQEKGPGFSLQTIKNDIFGSTSLFVIFEVVNDKYMVLLHCVGRDDTMYMTFFSVFARKAMNKPSISEEEITQLVDKILQQTDSKITVSLYYDNECFINKH